RLAGRDDILLPVPPAYPFLHRSMVPCRPDHLVGDEHGYRLGRKALGVVVGDRPDRCVARAVAGPGSRTFPACSHHDDRRAYRGLAPLAPQFHQPPNTTSRSMITLPIPSLEGLVTERLLFRRLRNDDLDWWMDYINSAEAIRFMPFEVGSRRDAEGMIRRSQER